MSPQKKVNDRSRGAQLARKAQAAAKKSARGGSAGAKGRSTAAGKARGGDRGGVSRRASGAATAAPATDSRVLTVGFIPGVEPDSFARRWASDPARATLNLVPLAAEAQEGALARGDVDMVFARLPLASAASSDTEAGTEGQAAVGPTPPLPPLHTVALWEERTVAVMGTDHNLTLHDELRAEDLDGEHEFPAERRGDEKDRVEIVASGVGYTLMPMSLARLYHRKDATYRPLADQEGTHIALVWPSASDDDLRQEFVAVVRGRTARSGR